MSDEALAAGHGPDSGRSTRDRWRVRMPLLRWYVSYGTFGVPQAAAPIAFALLTIPLTGSAEDGAAMVLAMTLAQIAGAIPVSRLGHRFNAVTYLRLLLVVRTIALALVAILAGIQASFPLLLAAAALAGLVNGACYGYLRAILNHLVQPAGLPRSLGIAATLNEVSFALAPVIASALGSVSPLFAVSALVVMGAVPLLLIPSIPEATSPPATDSGLALLTRPILLWLFCTAACSTAIAAVEVGAVSMAISFGLEPAWGFVFTVALCVASVSGGVFVSVRNRLAGEGEVVLYLLITTVGTVLVTGGWSLRSTLAGSALIGFCLPPLGTHYSLMLDRLAPADQRAEVFALMRTANAVGIIVISGLLALSGLPAALLGSTALMTAATVIVGIRTVRRSREARRTAEHRGAPSA